MSGVQLNHIFNDGPGVNARSLVCREVRCWIRIVVDGKGVVMISFKPLGRNVLFGLIQIK